MRQALPVQCGVALLFAHSESLEVNAYRVDPKNPPAKYGVYELIGGGGAEIHIAPMVFGKYQLNHNLGASAKNYNFSSSVKQKKAETGFFLFIIARGYLSGLLLVEHGG